MKKAVLVIIVAFVMMLTFAACTNGNGIENSLTQSTAGSDRTEQTEPSDKTDTSVTPQSPGQGESGTTTTPTEGKEDKEDEEINAMYLYINGNKLEVTLAKNASVDALIEILKKGDITYTADDYGGFEKVGSLGHTLPRTDESIKTSAGDVILYQGNSLCLYYGSNSWTFTRMGKINGYSEAELRSLLGAGNGSIQVRISLK